MRFLRSILAVLLSGVIMAAPVQAQFGGVTFTGGAANYPIPDFSMCDFNVPTTFTNVWYIDPVNGFTQNDYTNGTGGAPLITAIGGVSGQGTTTHPWSSLNAVFATVTGYPRPLLTTAQGGSVTLSPIAPGDEILLNTGTAAQYGVISASAGFGVLINNPIYLTIQAAPSQAPVLLGLTISNATRIHFAGISIQKVSPSTTLLSISGSGGAFTSKNIVLDNMSVSAADYATSATWTTQAAWISGIGTASGVNATVNSFCTALIHSHIFNVLNAVTLLSWPSHFLIQDNEIDHWGEDALDYMGQYLVISRNHLHDPVNLGTGAHMDFMQGFSSGTFPANHDIWIDSNLEVYQEDPNLPFTNVPTVSNGGITQTNNQWSNLFITNNMLAINAPSVGGVPVFPNTIGIGGCNDCVLANNTTTGILIVNLADLTRGSLYASSHITVTNNLVGATRCTDPNVDMTNNLIMKSAVTNNTVCFGGVISSNFGGTSGTFIGNNVLDVGGVSSELTDIDQTLLIYNFHLLSLAPARGAGQSALPRPLTDAFGKPQNSPVDAGAIAYP